MDLNELKEKINAFFEKLPFKKLAEKIPAGTRAKVPLLDKAIPFANQIVCGLAVVLVVTVVAASASGGSKYKPLGTGKLGTKEAPASDFVYDLNKAGDGVVITGYKGKGGDLVIPSMIEGYPVVEFAANSLDGFSPPTRFVLDAKGKIDLNASYQDYSKGYVTSVVFPDSITEMAATDFGSGGVYYKSRNAFSGDIMQAVKFPKNIKEIPNLGFGAALRIIVWPESLEIIGAYAFSGLSLTSIVIPDGVKEIRNGAFEGCERLTYVKIPDSIEIIGEYAFRGCSELTKVDIPAKSIKYASYGDFGWSFYSDRHTYREDKNGITFLASGPNNGLDVFQGCSNLPLAERKKIEDTGYRGTFTDASFLK
jgi:hypothetical protein